LLLSEGGYTWAAITGTGCAHWVAHPLGISQGVAFNQCLEGRTIRVPDLVAGKARIAKAKDVKVNDTWANGGLNHCGLVAKVETDKAGTYFHGQGDFHR